MPAVPCIYELLADVGEDRPADVSSVRLFLSGGDFLPTATAARFQRRYGKPIRQTYGSSEAGSVAWDCRDQGHAVAGSVGHHSTAWKRSCTTSGVMFFPQAAGRCGAR